MCVCVCVCVLGLGERCGKSCVFTYVRACARVCVFMCVRMRGRRGGERERECVCVGGGGVGVNTHTCEEGAVGKRDREGPHSAWSTHKVGSCAQKCVSVCNGGRKVRREESGEWDLRSKILLPVKH